MEFLGGLLILSLVFGFPTTAQAQSGNEIKQNSLAEQWILKQVSQGEVADLALYTPNEQERVIRAEFIRQILKTTSVENILLNGITVKNARVIGDLYLQHAEINFPVSFEGFKFDGNVSFCRDHFRSTFSIVKSVFEYGVNFCSAKGDDSILLIDNEFKASADFSGLEVNGNLGLQKTSFACSAQFGGSKIHGSLFLDDAVFSASSQTISFEGIHVDNTIFLNRAKFSGSASFYGAYVGSHFVADDAQFENLDGTVNSTFAP
jgi:hypothetical protein